MKRHKISSVENIWWNSASSHLCHTFNAASCHALSESPAILYAKWVNDTLQKTLSRYQEATTHDLLPRISELVIWQEDAQVNL